MPILLEIDFKKNLANLLSENGKLFHYITEDTHRDTSSPQ